MAMVTDGGFVLALPYTTDWNKWVVQAAIGENGFYVNANSAPITSSQGADLPPYRQDDPMVMDTSGNWAVLFKMNLYKRTYPPAGEPQVPVYEETNDYIQCEFQMDDKRTYVDQHDPYAGYIENGEDARMWMRFVLYEEGEDPVVIVNQNQSGGARRYDIQSWVQGWIYEGNGINISGIGGLYQNNLDEAGELIDNQDELLGVVIWLASGPRIKSTGNVDFRQVRSVGCGINLTKLGYSLQFYDTEEDPYIEPDEDDDGFSGPGGGNGDHDKSSDDIGLPPDPTISATQCGFVTLYNPTLAQIQALASQINSETFFDTLKNFFDHAQDYIAGLAIIPVQPSTAGPYHPKMGWHELDVAMPVITSQYVTVDCGYINVHEFYGASFDYSPATRLQLYLPYLGYINIDTDEVMDKQLSVKYKVDVYNGNCVAFVFADGSIIGQYNGNCMQQIPVSSITFDDVIRNSILLAGSIGGAIVGGVAAGAAAGAVSSGVTEAEGMARTANASASIGSGLLDIMMSKPTVERSGSLGSSLGLMSVQKPHLIKIIPRQSIPKQYKEICGYPSNITATLGSLRGYVQVDKIHISGVTGTDDERNEIITLLNGGVLI